MACTKSMRCGGGMDEESLGAQIKTTEKEWTKINNKLFAFGTCDEKLDNSIAKKTFGNDFIYMRITVRLEGLSR